MLVKELALQKPIICLVDDYLQKSAQILQENDLVCLPVVENSAHKNILGFISDKEICRQAIAKGLDPRKTTVGRIMNSRYFLINSETRTDECKRIMNENNVDFLFVIEDNNSLSGIVTKDLLPESEHLFDPPRAQIQYINPDRLF